MQISVMVLELYELEIDILASDAKFDLKGQKSFWEKPAHIIKEVARKKRMQISVTVLEIYEFRIYILTSEESLTTDVTFDHGGQSSTYTKFVPIEHGDLHAKFDDDMISGF